MKPDGADGSLDAHRDDVDAWRALHRRAADLVDGRPDPAVRDAVLAAAARAVAARPHAIDERRTAPFVARRWPWSAAAVLVVSLMAGLVAERTTRDEPARIVVATAPTSPAPVTKTPAAPEPVPAPPQPRRSGGGPHRTAPGDATAPARRPSPAPPVERFVPDPPPAASPRVDAEPATVIASQLQPAPDPPPAPAAPPAPVPASPALATSMGAAAPPSADDATPGLQRSRRSTPATPEAWVDRIVRLRAAGRDDEADRELDALRARYPEFAVPAAAVGPR